MIYTRKIIEDENGDLILELPKEVVEHLGLEEGDSIYWEVSQDGKSLVLKGDAGDE
jgi:antitoxin component of MazEF toxin-antitoxin module